MLLSQVLHRSWAQFENFMASFGGMYFVGGTSFVLSPIDELLLDCKDLSRALLRSQGGILYRNLLGWTCRVVVKLGHHEYSDVHVRLVDLFFFSLSTSS